MIIAQVHGMGVPPYKTSGKMTRNSQVGLQKLGEVEYFRPFACCVRHPRRDRELSWRRLCPCVWLSTFQGSPLHPTRMLTESTRRTSRDWDGGG
ncbi:hypothetical protein BU26DRAFT_140220 [Trematosphaeria pertusa]|uniref:Uncharacterized protein n=1 Tax=Trematosphaeria pertusa TaxID=390896 RepID=A0A6A6IY40_9PLEO|nr:uncharacterized protein BU26DRAFT_140220 [Trematosphaeria pertusa]KAF2254540.1 hypothetical protein BU26DRAFT_140220 [Trematosphaeria pertusa]